MFLQVLNLFWNMFCGFIVHCSDSMCRPFLLPPLAWALTVALCRWHSSLPRLLWGFDPIESPVKLKVPRLQSDQYSPTGLGASVNNLPSPLQADTALPASQAPSAPAPPQAPRSRFFVCACLLLFRHQWVLHLPVPEQWHLSRRRQHLHLLLSTGLQRRQLSKWYLTFDNYYNLLVSMSEV
jgi:hypothetical protein